MGFHPGDEFEYWICNEVEAQSCYHTLPLMLLPDLSKDIGHPGGYRYIAIANNRIPMNRSSHRYVKRNTHAKADIP